LERASLDLGRGRLQTFFRVSLPLLKPAVFSSAMLAFIFSFGNLEISLFLVAPGETTLPVAMMQYVETRLDPTVAAMAVVQLTLIVVLLALANKLFGFGRTFTGGLKQ
jgi:putative spermidine/putrescine transport system permease protein